MSTEKTSDILEKRRSKINDLREQAVDVYPNDFKVFHTVADIMGQVQEPTGTIGENGPQFVAAGRMMAVNRFGKAAFVRFRDQTGQMQGYIRKDKVGDRSYDLFKQLDIGDIIGLSGTLFKTKTGEWTLLVEVFRSALQIDSPLAGKIPRPQRSREALSTALCRPDHECRSAKDFFTEISNNSGGA